jgi:hypothetical protein
MTPKVASAPGKQLSFSLTTEVAVASPSITKVHRFSFLRRMVVSHSTGVKVVADLSPEK